jgi:hypothetical protein
MKNFQKIQIFKKLNNWSHEKIFKYSLKSIKIKKIPKKS